MKKLQKVAMVAAVAAALSASASAYAVTGIKFDVTGGGAGIGVDQFNWVATQALAQATFAPILPVATGDTFISDGYLYGQGQLDTVRLAPGAGTIGGVAYNAITYQFRIPVTATVTAIAAGGGFGAGSFVSFADRALMTYGADNYFRIFVNSDGAEVSQAAGTGYGTSEGEVNASQSIIFEGKVNINNIAGSTFSIQNTALNPIGTGGTLAQGGIPIVTVGGSGSINLNIEHCSAQNVLDAVAQCAGGVTALNTNYFTSEVEGLNFDVNLGNGIQVPFSQQDVPAVVVNQTPNFGGVVAGQLRNNFTCEGAAPCDMLYQGQNAVSTFLGTFLPEPGSLMLLGMGLLGIGASIRRKQAA